MLYKLKNPLAMPNSSIMALVAYLEFVNVPLTFYKTIGQELFQPFDKHRLMAWLLKVNFIFGIVNYNTQLICQIILLLLAVKSSAILEITAVAPCLGFAFLGNAKQMTLHLNKKVVRRILIELEQLFPNTRETQEEFNVAECVRTLKPVMKLFASLCIFNTFYFGLYPLFKSIYKSVVIGEKFDFPLGFPIWYPYDHSANWLIYTITYCLQFNAAYLTGVAFLTADLLLVSSVSQLCMHFDYISKNLKHFKPTTAQANHGFLKNILKHHVKCLDLSESVDKVFGFSLLLNFLSSAGTLCFVGFQVLSASTEEVLRFGILLLISLAQVLIICIYGNNLIDTSLFVADAAFGHPWYECDLVYKKMLIFIIQRSQKFAAIHAPTFPPVSLQTFMNVISMSYQFFAVLQTMDNK